MPIYKLHLIDSPNNHLLTLSPSHFPTLPSSVFRLPTSNTQFPITKHKLPNKQLPIKRFHDSTALKIQQSNIQLLTPGFFANDIKKSFEEIPEICSERSPGISIEIPVFGSHMFIESFWQIGIKWRDKSGFYLDSFFL